jgi:hypothetical protein
LAETEYHPNEIDKSSRHHRHPEKAIHRLGEFPRRRGPKLKIHDPNNEYTAYLIENVGRDSDLARALKRYYRTIFEHELAAWHTDPKAWPRKRDLQTFEDWFEVQLSSMALNLCNHRIEVEEFEV